MTRPHKAMLVLSALALVGCLGVPDMPPTRPYDGGTAPGLIPIRAATRQIADGPLTPLLLSAPPAERLAALRAREAQLRRPLIPPAERARLIARAANLERQRLIDPFASN